MKQRTMIVAAIAMMPFMIAVAQQTPPVPVTPVTPVTPVPMTAPVPMIAPMPVTPMIPDWIDREDIRRMADEARIQGQLAAEEPGICLGFAPECGDGSEVALGPHDRDS